MKKIVLSLVLLAAGCLCAVLVGEAAFRLWFGIGLNRMPYLYALDGDGFRNPQGAPWNAPGEARRIAVLGDSYSYGYGVHEADIYPRLLQDRAGEFSTLPVRVANFSLMGLNTEAAVDIFLDRPDRDVFDTVILGFTFNDIEREPIRVENPRALPLAFQFTMLHSLLMAGYQARQYVSYGGKDYAQTLQGFYADKDSEEWRRMSGAVLRLHEYCARTGKRLILLLFEIYCEGETSLRSTVHDEMRRFAAASGIAFVDIPPLRECDRGPYQVHAFDTHPSAQGHALAFEALKQYFLQKGTP